MPGKCTFVQFVIASEQDSLTTSRKIEGLSLSILRDRVEEFF